jgi:hypothetical protein
MVILINNVLAKRNARLWGRNDEAICMSDEATCLKLSDRSACKDDAIADQTQ